MGLAKSELYLWQVAEFYEHRRLLASIIDDPGMELHHPLQPGTMAVVHNHRVMHGRTAFVGTRGLCGCYIGDDEFRSRLRLLARSTKGSDGEGEDAWNVLLAEGMDNRAMPPTSTRY